MAQIVDFLCLATDTKEWILFLPLTTEGHDPVKEWQVRPLTAEPKWGRQRKLWLMTGGPSRGRRESPLTVSLLRVEHLRLKPTSNGAAHCVIARALCR